MASDLSRFVEAQDDDFDLALAEIKAGRKQSHWMWYIFPQYKGLGFSENSKYYAIQDLQEARDYLHHEVLGPRLKQITNELLLLEEDDAGRIFGSPDNMKLRSGMTLFAMVDESDEGLFKKVLEKFFDGKPDSKTLTLIKESC